MKAVLYEAFSQPPQLTNVPDPTPEAHGVVVRVMATGVCRSDWHGWVGHDKDITLPHVPGHELAGVVEAVGRDVRKWKRGDRVTVPFVCGCGECPQCQAGHQQVCDHQFQPGFTHWGSFAEFVAIHRADLNLVALPENLAFDTAASLGCRFATSFRAVVDQGRTSAGQWVAVHGCGGVGLSAVMIANALGANVIGVDIADDKLALARELGAVATINANVRRRRRRSGDRGDARRRACVDRRAWGADDLLQFGQLPAQARQARAGRPAARRSQRAAHSDEPGDRQRARTARQPRHAGASLRRDAGDGASPASSGPSG